MHLASRGWTGQTVSLFASAKVRQQKSILLITLQTNWTDETESLLRTRIDLSRPAANFARCPFRRKGFGPLCDCFSEPNLRGSCFLHILKTFADQRMNELV